MSHFACSGPSSEGWLYLIENLGKIITKYEKAERRRIDAFELPCWRRFLSRLDCKEVQPVHPKGDQSWVFVGRTDVETETTILWPPGVKS